MTMYTAICLLDTDPHFSIKGEVRKTANFQALYRQMRSELRYARHYGNDVRWEVRDETGKILLVFAT